MMSQRLRAIPYMLLLLVLAEIAARIVFVGVSAPQTWDSPYTLLKTQQMTALDCSTDVVFVGSSVTAAAIDPAVFVGSFAAEITAYNAAIPGQTARVTRQWVIDEVLPQTDPKVVVIGVTVREYNDSRDSSESELVQYVNSRGRRQASGRTTTFEEILAWAETRSALFRLRTFAGSPSDLVKLALHRSLAGAFDVSPLGHQKVFEDMKYQPPLIEETERRDYASFDVGGTESLALIDLVEAIKAFGAVPVIVQMPVLNDDLAALLPNGRNDLEMFQAQLSNDAAVSGAIYVDSSGWLPSEQVFADLYHLNREGTVTLSSRLGDLLSSLLAENLPSGSCGS